MRDTAAALFDDVVAASRLNNLIAPFAISRLLVAADVDPRALDMEGLRRALPRIEEGLAVYLRGEQLDGALGDIRALAGA